jgi:hypothetical protein
MVCRICLGDDKPDDLIAPCNCKGSALWVHRSCLDEWRAQAAVPLAFTHCSVCMFPYVLAERPAPSRGARTYFGALVVRDTFACFIVVQCVIAAIGWTLHAIDRLCNCPHAINWAAPCNATIPNLFPEPWADAAAVKHFSLGPYYIAGVVVFLAILGVVGSLLKCCGKFPSSRAPPPSESWQRASAGGTLSYSTSHASARARRRARARASSSSDCNCAGCCDSCDACPYCYWSYGGGDCSGCDCSGCECSGCDCGGNCGDCDCGGGGGDAGGGILVVLVAVVVVFAVVGIFVGIFFGTLLFQRIVQRHVQVLHRRAEARFAPVACLVADPAARDRTRASDLEAPPPGPTPESMARPGAGKPGCSSDPADDEVVPVGQPVEKPGYQPGPVE